MRTSSNAAIRRLMNKGLWCVLTAAVLGGASIAVAQEAASTPVTALAEATVANGYVWRGQVYNDEAVLQPSFTMGKGAFTINTWGNMNLTDSITEDSADLSELDLAFGYSKTVGAVAIGAGLIEYSFPNTTFTGTREVYATMAIPGLFVVPTLSVNYDFDEADGAYANLAFSYSHSIAEKATLAMFASLGMGTSDYNAFYFGVDDNALNDLNVGVSLAIPVTKSLTITPAVQYTSLPDSDIEDGAAGVDGEPGLYLDKDFVLASIKASYVF